MRTQDRKGGTAETDKGILWSSIALSIVTCFMFFIYAPLELYFTNKDDFWFDIWVLLPIMVCVFLISASVCVIGFFLLYKVSVKLYNTAAAVLFIVFLCSYVQGNFMVKYLPVMNGKMIDWNQYASEGRMQSVVLWIVVVVAVLLMIKLLHMNRMYTIIRVVSICMLLMLTVTLFTVCMTNSGLESKTNVCVTTDYEMAMSSDVNFVILLLDAMDGGAFSDLVVGDEEEESIFDDFTYYDNVICAYPQTTYNVPLLLSGMWFENQIDRNEFFNTMLTESPLFDTLESRGYTIDLYEVDAGIDETTMNRFENVDLYTKKVSSYADFVRWQILLVGMRYAPFDLKRFSFVNPTAFESLRVIDGDKEAFRDDNNVDFYRMLTEQDIEYREGNNFKFIHLWGAHAPYVYDKDLNYLPEGGTYVQSAEACITLSAMYLQKLKEAGVYDNTIIIICSDHGDSMYYDEDNMNQHPILLIKGIGDRHEFTVDSKPLSFDNMQEAYVRLMDGGEGQAVFDAVPLQDGRRFLWYDIKDEKHMLEYEQTGKAGEMNTMKLTGREFNAEK